MLFIKKIFCFFFLIVFATQAKSQEANNQSLAQIEDSLKTIFKHLTSDASFTVKEEYNNKFVSLFKVAIGKDNAFDWPFDSLKNIGKIASFDGRLRVFTWNVPQLGGYQSYFGYILFKKSKNKIQIFELNDSRKLLIDPAKEILSVKNWMGALYYSVIEQTYKGKTHYLLLGFDFNDLFSSKKIIEVLTFGPDSEPVFGSNVFKVDDNFIARVVFEFSARATMTLRYIEDNKTIVFDHLSPSSPELSGNYQFYGPDFTFDGFRFERGKWIYVRNLDIRNQRKEPTKPKDTPEKLPEPGFLYKSKGGLPMKISK
jgi:hypothetical protein